MKVFLEIIEFIKEFHRIPIEIFKRCLYRENFISVLIGGIVSLLILISVIACDIFIIYGIIWLIKRIIINIRTRKIVIERVKGTVTKKEYEESYYQYIPTGKTVVPVYHPERFFICVDYNDKKIFFEDEEKYKSVEPGDKIQLVQLKKIDKNGKLIEVKFELED